MANFFHRTLNLSTIVALQAGVFTAMMPSNPAAAGWNQFDFCVYELQDKGISDQQAVTACSDALRPKELSECVQRIASETPVTGEEALSACFRVRRPVELADCTIGISDEAADAFVRTTQEDVSSGILQPTALLALNSCRRSLLPKRYAECVIAGSRSTDLTTDQAMNTCIRAEDFPRTLFPSSTSF